ncbi:DUF1501 domain-containing protein [Neptunomonas sp.]|uniref:DUF1501 domain-containing protein n=1 Tax=Neptunomonas sp. TaxID=1971898 RepID=UPI0035642B98
MNRRSLLKLAAVSPFFAHGLVCSAQKIEMPILLLVELNGGNDSLNTVVPLSQLERYNQLRPTLGLKGKERIPLDQNFALHHSLKPLLSGWEAGELALVHGLGYPDPNRSHFRSIDIWDTASASNEFLDDGWLSRGIASVGQHGIDGVVFGRNARAFNGNSSNYLQMTRLQAFLRQADAVNGVVLQSDNEALNHVIGLQNAVKQGHSALRDRLSKNTSLVKHFPNTKFGRQLADIAQIIQLDLGVPAFKVALSGFDTHNNQSKTHSNRLKVLAEGLDAFRRSMRASEHWRNILVVTYSEFGRRAAQNGSGGTDHGTAASHFVMGGRVKGGHLGRHPDLEALVDQDIEYTTDFRQLYHTILTDWWSLHQDLLTASAWPGLDLIRES